MKKKTNLFVRAAMTLLLAVFYPFCGLEAQETLTVYDGTVTNSYVPIYCYYFDDFTRSQYVIPAEDLNDMVGGTIHAITYYTNLTSSYTTESTVDVYLKQVPNTSISAFEDKATATIVYQGTLSFADGQITITFPTPFSYNGGNLLVGCENTTDAGYKSISFYGQTVNGASWAGSNGSSLANVTGGQKNFIPKTTFTYTPDPTAIAKPVNLTATNVMATTATISWTSEESVWNLRYKSADATEWTNVNNLATKTYTITGLAANTSYNVQVQVVKGEETSRWASATFTTALGLPYKPTFATKLPDGWGHYWGKLEDVQAGTATLTALKTGSDSYAWNMGNNPYVHFSGSQTKTWLVTPAIELEQASNLSFDLWETGYWGSGDPATTGTDDRFVVLYSTDDGHNWTQLALWDNAGSERVLNNLTSTATTFKLDFPAACAGKSVKVAFYAESTVNNASNRLYLGNIVFDDANRCLEPTDLTAANVTSRTATVGWTSDGNLFNLQYKKASDAAWTTVSGINAKTYALTGLTPKADYTFRVQTDCGGSQSIWSEEGTFTTQFGVPFTETFVNSSRPEGWTGYSTLMSGVLDGTTTLSEHQNNGAWGFIDSSGDYYAYVNLTSQYEKQWLVTPDIIMDVNNSQLTFDLQLVNSDKTGSDDQFAVLVTDDGGTTWTQLALWNNSSSARVFNDISYNGEQVALNLSAYYGKTIRLAFYAESTVENASNVIRIDNVSVDVKPAADVHRPQNLAVGNITKNSATITWAADAAVTQWNIQYGLRKNSYRYEKTSNTNSYDLTLLNAGTNYEVLVQAVSADGNSSWSNISFVTDFPEDRCNISYTLKSKNEYGWNGTTIKVVDNTTGIEVTSLTLAAGKSEESGTLELCNKRTYDFVWIPKEYYGDCSYSFFDVNGDEFLYADAGKTGQKTTLTSYKMDCTIVNCHQPKNLKADDVGFYSVTASWTPGDEDQEKWEVVCRTSYGAPTATTVGTEVTTTSYTFSNLNTNYTYYIYVRGVKGEEKSKWSRCLQIRTKNAKAVPTDVEADNESFTTADVDWTVNGIETKWNLRYRVNDYGSFTYVDGITAHPYTLTGLTPDTYYEEVQVQPVYDDNSTGSWSEAGTIWTKSEKAPPSDLEQTAATTTTATLGWTKNGTETKWNLLYHVSEWVKPISTFDFEDGLPEGWTTIDNDGDGRTWKIASSEDYLACHSGEACVVSASYDNDTHTGLHPDNWLVTSQFQLGGLVKFWMRGQDDKDFKEHFAVYVSTTGTNVSDFTLVMPETVTKDEYTMYVVDLSAYSGKGYVAFRHFNCTDQFYLNLDDVTILVPDDERGLKKNLTETSCTITGLTPGTVYEAYVQAVYDDGTTSDWTDGEWFATIPLGDINGDFRINVVDIVYLRRYLNGGTKLPNFVMEAADVNQSGTVDDADVEALKDIIMTNP